MQTFVFNRSYFGHQICCLYDYRVTTSFFAWLFCLVNEVSILCFTDSVKITWQIKIPEWCLALNRYSINVSWNKEEGQRKGKGEEGRRVIVYQRGQKGISSVKIFLQKVQCSACIKQTRYSDAFLLGDPFNFEEIVLLSVKDREITGKEDQERQSPFLSYIKVFLFGWSSEQRKIYWSQKSAATAVRKWTLKQEDPKI